MAGSFLALSMIEFSLPFLSFFHSFLHPHSSLLHRFEQKYAVYEYDWQQ